MLSAEAGRLVVAVKSEPYNPRVVADFWQSLLRISDVVRCVYSQAELKGLAKRGRGPVYVPNVTYPQLGKIFSHLGSWAVAKESTVKDESEAVGWTNTEMGLEAPYGNTTESQLQEIFAKEDRVGARLGVGILASVASKLLAGHYFDERSWSRYLGSRYEGRVVNANFYSGGGLGVGSDLLPEDHYPTIGGRSEEEK